MKTPAAFNWLQASTCPPRKRKPRMVAAVHQPLNFARARDFSARRATSRATLDASRIAVLSSRMGGFAMEAQSSLRPRRTTRALVKAANSMVLAASITNKPVNDARRKAPRPSKPPPPSAPPPPSPGGGGGPCPTSRALPRAPTTLDGRRRRTLHDVVRNRPGHIHPHPSLTPSKKFTAAL